MFNLKSKANSSEKKQQDPPPSFLLSMSNDSLITGQSSQHQTDVQKSQCSSLSDGESFECYGENDVLPNDGVELELTPNLISTRDVKDNLPNRRWGSMKHSAKRQLGSNALASHLYRSSSFNSSSRSSNCDTTEDMYSDVSLEDVQDLNIKIDILQRQVNSLANIQNNEDRTLKTKTDYAVLQARYHILEEQLRDTEIRSDERSLEENKRHREILARVEREASLQNENSLIRIRTTELETHSLREEVQRLRLQCDKQAADLHSTEEKLEATRENLLYAQRELIDARASAQNFLAEKLAAEDVMVELGKEIERLRSESGPALPTTSSESLRLEELHQEMEDLRIKNKYLENSNEELHAMLLSRSVEEGRNLLNDTSNSLAQEFEAMSLFQDTSGSSKCAPLSQLQSAYQDKEDENQRLKHYIDTILLNIVENYPQLLEVKASLVS